MRVLRTVLIAAAVLVSSLPGQMVLTMTDGTTTRGSLVGIGPDGTWAWRGLSGPVQVRADKVVGLDSGSAIGSPPEGSFRVDLSSGDSVIGTIEDASVDDVRVRNPAFGEAAFSLDDVVAIWNLAIPRSPESLPPVQGDGEMLYVDRDGRVDYRPGTLERIGKGQLTFKTVAGEKQVYSFDRDRIIAVLWAQPQSRPSKDTASIVTLQDGSRLTGTLLPSDGATLAVKLAVGPEVTIDLRLLKSLAILNPSLRYLSDVEPASFSETPLFSGVMAQGLHRDRGLRSGQPLRVGRQTFTKGLLVPARARVSYKLDGSFTRFVAMVGADAAASGRDLSGSVKAKVLVDGKPAWESGVLRGGQPPEAVEVGTLKGARELAIEVDFGDSFDAGARAVFGNAMLIK
jgi:hypothetical protein